MEGTNSAMCNECKKPICVCLGKRTNYEIYKRRMDTVDIETEQSIYSCNNYANCKFKLLGTSNYGCSYGKYCDFKVPRDSRKEK